MGGSVSRMLLLLVGVAAFTGCAPESQVGQTQPTGNPLSANAPDPRVGDTFAMQRESGETVTTEVIGVDGNVITASTGGRCVYRRRIDSYAPALSWENCDGGSGSLNFKAHESMFPLGIGKEVTYSYSGINPSGDYFDVTRECKVLGTARITVPAGDFDTFHIACDDGSWKRNYYYAPELGIDVFSERIRHVGSQDYNYVNKLISYSPAPR